MIVERFINLLIKLTGRLRKQPVQKLRIYVGISLVFLGMLVGGMNSYLLWRSQQSVVRPNHSSHALKNSQPKKDASPLIEGTPVHLTIPNVSIDLNVIPGYYNPDDQSWTLSLDNAQYGVITPKANNKQGDTFIYGHYRWGVFYNLPKIQVGDQAVVTTDNGHAFTYTFSHSTITTPEDTSIFDYKGQPILVLQTCTGLWYQDRQLFVFDLTSVS